MKLEAPWGEKDRIELELPPKWRLLDEARPGKISPLANARGETARALDNPTAAEPLGRRDLKGKRIVVVVDDLTRPTPVWPLLTVVLDKLEASGALRRDILALIATGVHRPMTPQEVEDRLGPENLEGIRWANHDCRDTEGNVALGTSSRGTPVILDRALVEADFIVLIGCIEPHVLAGFGGGLKNIVPGTAAAETIGANHLVGVDPDRPVMVGVDPGDCPIRMDAEECAGRLEAEVFLVNVVLAPGGGIAGLFTGNPVRAHREGIALAAEIYGVPVGQQSDVVVCSSHPRDEDLRQAMKGVCNAVPAARPGGVIIGLLKCDGGVGDVRIPDKSLPHGVLRTILRIIGPSRILGFIDRVSSGAGIEEKFMANLILQIVRRNRLLLYAPSLPQDLGRRMGTFELFDDVGALTARARRLAPSSATVNFFPYSGVTYPVIN